MPTLAELESIIREAWTVETTDSPEEWDPANPAAGHCGVSAYVLQRLLGGELVIAEIGGTDPQQRHAWNRFDSGLEIDITADQFATPPALTECEIPHDMLMRKIGARGELLLQRVRARLLSDEH